VLPYRIAAPSQVVGKFRFASGFEPLHLIRRKILVSKQQVLAAVALHDVPVGQYAPDHVLRNLRVIFYLTAVLV
jgi:hypothetical protein